MSTSKKLTEPPTTAPPTAVDSAVEVCPEDRSTADPQRGRHAVSENPGPIDASVVSLHAQIARFERERESLRRDREHLAWLLLESEQLAARLVSAAAEATSVDEASFERPDETRWDEERKGLEAELGRLRAEGAAQFVTAGREAGELRSAIASYEEMVGVLREQIESVHRSTSWRVTRPLRRMSGWARGNQG